MLKGDMRKKQILETAERLFCEKGYEKTSVQDILDVLKLSKGSFYHHYESKETLLQGMCVKRADAAAQRLTEDKTRQYGIAGVNQTIGAMIPFNGEGLEFLSVLLPVFLLPEGRSIRDSYQEALKAAFRGPLLNALDSAAENKDIFMDAPEQMAEICLDLINDLWSAVSEKVIRAEVETGESPDMGDILALIDPYRKAIESILTAPFGSLTLISMPELQRLTTEMHSRITKQEQNSAE